MEDDSGSLVQALSAVDATRRRVVVFGITPRQVVTFLSLNWEEPASNIGLEANWSDYGPSWIFSVRPTNS